LPEIRAYMAKARLRRGIEIIKLANRIEALKMQEDDEGEAPADSDLPNNSEAAAVAAVTGSSSGGLDSRPPGSPEGKRSLSAIAKQSIFREVVMAKVRETKEAEQAKAIEAEANEQDAKKKSF
jgi:calcium/calmodulin-dependent protein kinase I